MKRPLFIVLLFLQALLLHAQVKDTGIVVSGKISTTTIHHFSASTDLAQYMLIQPNAGIEYRIGCISFGLNGAIINPDPMFRVNILTTGQYKWPGTRYNGNALRLYVKLYDSKESHNYTSLQAVGKNEWFNNEDFTDKIYGTDLFVDYTMNETATVYGIELLRGHEAYEGDPLYFDVFYGVGVHERFMNYDVIKSDALAGMPLGPGYYFKSYVTFVFGARLVL